MTETDNTPPATDVSVNDRCTGRVKWFNNRAGYGFITIQTGSKTGLDVFVHHTAICVEQEQYRYLVQGEYIECDLCTVTDSEHNLQAGNIRGMNGGKLMCETCFDSRTSRPNMGEEDNGRNKVSADNARGVRSRGSGPRGDMGDEWMLVRRRTGRRDDRGRRSDDENRPMVRARPPRMQQNKEQLDYNQ